MGLITVVFLLRGVAACRLSWHGSSWVLSPNLDRFASHSKVFDNHLSNSINPILIENSLFPQELIDALLAQGVCLVWLGSDTHTSNRSGFESIPCHSDDPMDWSLKLNGLLTRKCIAGKLIVIDLPHALPPWNLGATELEMFFPKYKKMHLSSRLDVDEKQETAVCEDEFVDAEPWDHFLPDSVSEDDDLTHLRIIETQAAAIYGLDNFIGSLLCSLPPSVAVLIIGDCGIEVGDRVALGQNNPWPWLSRVHVPCIWHDPNGDGVPQRIHSMSQHSDIAVTLASFFSPGMKSTTGSVPLDLGRLALSDSYSSLERAIISLGFEDCQSVRMGDWSLIIGRNELPRLFSYKKDKWEVFNLASQHLEVVEELRSFLN